MMVGGMGSCILNLSEIRKEHNELVGKKCANLGELTAAGFRVPPGFALTVGAYERFMKETGLESEIAGYLSRHEIDPSTPAGIAEVDKDAEHIRALVESTPLPADIDEGVRAFYSRLCDEAGAPDAPVSTRSAGPASHPGQYETYLNVSGADEVIRNVRRVWSSTFNTRSIVARHRCGMSLSYDEIGVAVLMMVNAKAAGVIFTVNPANGDPSKIYIESNWGLGEAVVSGEVSPDSFLLERETLEIVKSTISPKTIWYVPDEGGAVKASPVPEDMKGVASVTGEELRELAQNAIEIEGHFGVPQDIEWAVDKDLPFPENVFMLQARPVSKEFEAQSATKRIVGMLSRYI